MKVQGLGLAIGFAVLSYGMSSPAPIPPGPKQCEADRIMARGKPEDFRGDKWCANCHAGVVEHFKGSPHSALMADEKLPNGQHGCEGCHGPGNIHQAVKDAEVISFRKMSPVESSAACLRCHAQTLSASHWKGTEHSRAGLSCVSCHQIHPDSPPAWEQTALKKGKLPDPRKPIFTVRADPKALLKADEATLCGQCHAPQLAEFRSSTHHPMPEGRLVCSDCHDIHPSKASKLRPDATRDPCVKCHTERAGPFVYEHDPAVGMSGNGCVECHRPHGANNAKMLNSITRGLCGQCHTDKMATHFPARNCWSSGCHVAVHGSNTDPNLLKY